MKYYLRTLLGIFIISLMAFGFTYSSPDQPEEEWVSLFDGETLDGWQVGDNADTFWVKDGRIVVNGPRAHLFYNGPVENHDFKNFEFKLDVMTTEGSNSGVYFHTKYQKSGWPSKGYEVQVNNTQEDPRRTASLYGIDDVRKAPAADKEWFTMYIKVEGQKVTTKVDGKTLVEYTEPKDIDREGRVLSSGTFALQGHDPGSKVFYRNIMVKPL